MEHECKEREKKNAFLFLRFFSFPGVEWMTWVWMNELYLSWFFFLSEFFNEDKVDRLFG